MPLLRVATSRVTRSPVRVQQWNATIRAGDDVKLALTVYADDTGTPSVMDGSFSRLSLWPDERRGYDRTPDYGLSWYTGGTVIGRPGTSALQVDGYVPDIGGIPFPGRINFFIPGTTSAGLFCGRYRLCIQVDLADGEYSQVEGILQVREAWARPSLIHQQRAFFGLDISQLNGPAILAAAVSGAGIPVDLDGFLLAPAYVPSGQLPSGVVTVAEVPGLAAILPTTLPGTAGIFWNDGGLLCIS